VSWFTFRQKKQAVVRLSSISAVRKGAIPILGPRARAACRAASLCHFVEWIRYFAAGDLGLPRSTTKDAAKQLERGSACGLLQRTTRPVWSTRDGEAYSPALSRALCSKMNPLGLLGPRRSSSAYLGVLTVRHPKQ
jgi:hypothetical protein